MGKKRKGPKTPLQRFKENVRKHKNWPIIIAEGDSWFAYPGHNVIACVRKMGKFSLLSMAANGDEAVQMLGREQKSRMRKRLESFDVQALLFSAGGNDVVGQDLVSLLRDVKDPKNWEACLKKEAYQRKLRMIRGAYEELIALRNELRPQCTIITHGYDYPIPGDVGAEILGIKLAGPWMKPYFVARGLTDPAAQCALARFLLSGFNEMLSKLATKTPRFLYLDTPGTLAANEWGDEIHPTKKGFKKIAEHFKGALQQTFPDYKIG